MADETDPLESSIEAEKLLEWIERNRLFRLIWMPAPGEWHIYDGQTPGSAGTHRIGVGSTLREALRCALNTPYRGDNSGLKDYLGFGKPGMGMK